MLGLKVPLQEAQRVKQYLLQHDLLVRDHALDRQDGVIVFPVHREFGTPWEFDTEFVPMESREIPRASGLRDALLQELTPEERMHLRTAFDTVGTIAIIDIPPQLAHREQLIGETLLRTNCHIRTVLKKVGGHAGPYRTQRMQCIAGEDTRMTSVVENAITLRVNVEEAYYSVRMSTERKRILGLIRPGERVLCLFSGVGPYPLTFGKHSAASVVVGVEINPAAHELAVENLARNRCTNVRLLCGDAHDVVPRLLAGGERFDRVTMPLPQGGKEFLQDAIAALASGGTIHYYVFCPEGQFDTVVRDVQMTVERAGRRLVSWHIVRTGQQSPRVWRLCVDMVVD